MISLTKNKYIFYEKILAINEEVTDDPLERSRSCKELIDLFIWKVIEKENRRRGEGEENRLMREIVNTVICIICREECQI